LRQHGYLGIERANIGVHEVVLVAGAIFGQGLGDLGLLFEHHVFPDAAIGHLLLGLDRAVGIDGVAAMDEEIRAVLQHGRIGLHAPARFVDPPALAAGIA
jgi:high-affinity nickel permease